MTATPQICWLTPADPPDRFPLADRALSEPDGLLAAGGDLATERLLYAYRHGIFPWYDERQPILWWSPDPRCVLRPKTFRISRRLGRYMKQSELHVVFNRGFSSVINACQKPRPEQDGTWITPEMRSAYCRLHREGWAHSIEVFDRDDLVGGVYGIAIGRVFFGESMFSITDHASKFALKALCDVMIAHGLALLDCQVVSPHLLSLGAETTPRIDFLSELKILTSPAIRFEKWPNAPISVRDLC